MADIKVTSQDLHNVSSQLSSGSSDIEGRLSSLHAQVQTLVDNGWQGSASSAFHDLYTQWNTAAGQLKQALDGISKQLGNAATTYEQTEASLTQSMH
ncbi:MAG: family type secretion target [Frankiales bacterium]|jgi:WXG100 family type VII secretion target|nr:family type secretion target [Frankiales bacterium]